MCGVDEMVSLFIHFIAESEDAFIGEDERVSFFFEGEAKIGDIVGFDAIFTFEFIDDREPFLEDFDFGRGGVEGDMTQVRDAIFDDIEGFFEGGDDIG